MSRTRHHEQSSVYNKMKRKKSSLRQRYVEALRLDEWYIELPISNKIPKNIVQGGKVWN